MDQLESLVNAFAFTESIPQPLSGGFVITWRHTTLWNATKWAQLQTRLLDHSTKYLRQQGVTAAFIWTRERAKGHGAHTHFLAHLGYNPMPICQALGDELLRKFKLSPDGFHISMGRYRMLTLQMRAGHLRYILKGFDRRAFRYTGIGAEIEKVSDVLGIEYRGSQGIIAIKRCGTSQNIGPAARRAAGWREVRDLARLRRILHPDKVPASLHGDIPL